MINMVIDRSDINDIRKEMIKRRKSLDTATRLSASDIIADKLTGTSCYKDADILLVYADYGGEVATDRIINHALLDGKNVYAPVCTENCRLEFYRIFSLDEMYPGSYGIREPLKIEYLKLENKDISECSVCITPGTVFDRHGGRVGYGKGYYDRFFEEYKIDHRIGLAYGFQIVDKLELLPTDIPMTKVISEI